MFGVSRDAEQSKVGWMPVLGVFAHMIANY
jgi:hypothetical protein